MTARCDGSCDEPPLAHECDEPPAPSLLLRMLAFKSLQRKGRVGGRPVTPRSRYVVTRLLEEYHLPRLNAISYDHPVIVDSGAQRGGVEKNPVYPGSLCFIH